MNDWTEQPMTFGRSPTHPTESVRPLVDGINHIAVSTTDLDRFVASWSNTCGLAFHAEVDGAPFRHGMLMVGTGAAVHVFELHEEITGPLAVLPMFRCGRIDHFALNAPDERSLRTIRDRLVVAGASDGTVTLFESVPGFVVAGLLSVHIEDPEGGHSEICCVRILRVKVLWDHHVAVRVQPKKSRPKQDRTAIDGPAFSMSSTKGDRPGAPRRHEDRTAPGPHGRREQVRKGATVRQPDDHLPRPAEVARRIVDLHAHGVIVGDLPETQARGRRQPVRTTATVAAVTSMLGSAWFSVHRGLSARPVWVAS